MHETELVGLPFVRRGQKVRAGWARSVSGFMVGISSRRAMTFAGDAGAINVWIDDKMRYRCAFMRFLSVRDMQEFTTKAAVRGWLKVWLPRAYHEHV
jgi:hypothetical protein